MSCSSAPPEVNRLSCKNTTREIIDLHLFIWMKRGTSLLSVLRSAREDPKGAIIPVCPFYGGSKLWTGAAICFCPPLNFIYSLSPAIKPTIYDLLFN